MPSVLQEIAQQFDRIDPIRAKELRRIEQAYISFCLNDDAAEKPDAPEESTQHLLRFLSRMARVKEFRLYPIGVGERDHGRYAHQAIALLDSRHLPTPGNTLAVLDPVGAAAPVMPDQELRQYSFESWRTLQGYYGRGCALLPINPS
ncbi:MAG: hypothetical protein JNK31_08860 [Candidatus Competibacter sp.]|nr:hypothetical protein [Candidatus Competibacter sp.]